MNIFQYISAIIFKILVLVLELLSSKKLEL